MSSTEPSPGRKGKRIQWDEPNLKSNEEYAAANPKMKIDEPKTPFHHGAGPEAAGSPMQQPIGGALNSEQPEAGEYHEFRLEAGMHDLAALSATALDRRGRDSDDDEEDECGNLEKRYKVEEHQQFEEHRRAHYHTGGLAALRAQTVEDEEEQEEEEAAPSTAPVKTGG